MLFFACMLYAMKDWSTGWYKMKTTAWSHLALIGIMALLFVGCTEAQTVPQSRELVVINDTTEAQIYRIEIATSPFGQRMIDPSGYFHFEEEDVLESETRFSISLSPYVYRVVVTVRYSMGEGETYTESSRIVSIDLPAESAQSTNITLVYKEDSYTLEVDGAYVAYNFIDLK